MEDQSGLDAVRAKLLRQIASRAESTPEQAVTPETAASKGPPDRTEADFARIAYWGSRRAAVKEYNRTMEEFRQTGKIEEKAWGDFAHLVNPPDLQLHVFDAHCQASQEVDRWLDEQDRIARERERAQTAAKLLEAAELRDTGLSGAEAEENEPDEDEESEDEIGSPCHSSSGEALQDRQRRLATLKSRTAVEAPLPRAAAPLPTPALARPVGLLRGISFDPDAPGRNARFEPAIPQLKVAPVPAQLPPVDDQTEALLNAMIGECHFLMREVAFPSMCHASVADDRLSWISRAMDLARTGAVVAKAVARLRHGPSIRESHQKITVENKLAVVQGGGGCAAP